MCHASGDFTATGHFIVLTGMKDGKICVHDPNSKEAKNYGIYETLEGQINNLWEFTTLLILRKLHKRDKHKLIFYNKDIKILGINYEEKNCNGDIGNLFVGTLAGCEKDVSNKPEFLQQKIQQIV